MVEIAPRIVVDAQVRFGKPVIRGTRVPVHVLVAKLAGGMREQDVAEEYGVTLEDVRAALAYAARVLGEQEVRATARISQPPHRRTALHDSHCPRKEES